MIKKFLFAFILLFSLVTLKASHLSGGDIQYRYIGDSTGYAHHYEIYLRIYRDQSGVSLGNSQNVNLTSSCYSNLSINCSLVPGTGAGNVAPTLFDCVDPSPLTKTLEIWAYKGYAILAGPCSDYAFYWSSCCRPPGITNVSNSSSLGFYFDATLNNFIGNNSSPLFTSEPVRAFCVGNNFNWKQSSIEIDGDSLYYSLINCRELAGGPVNIPFATGWTANHPISTSPGSPGIMTLNNQTGNINFTPTAQEIDIMSVLIEEYRYDSTNNIYVKIGSSSRDMMVQILPTCNVSSQQGPLLDLSASTIYIDLNTGLKTMNLLCNDSSNALHFSNKLDCQTIAQNGSNFMLISASTLQPIPISSATFVCDANGETKDIEVNYHTPLIANGDYYLISKVGSNGNPISSKCGFSLPVGDTIVLRVSNCTGIGIDENKTKEVDLYPNPTTGLVTIDLLNTSASSLVLFSSSGQKLLSQQTTLEQNIQLDISSYEAGIYVLQLNTPEGAIFRRIVKQ